MITAPLVDGLTVDGLSHTAVELRCLSVGDVLDATEAAERAVATPAGWTLRVSEALLGAEVLRRQIVRVGGLPGPLSMPTFRRLSERDLGLLRRAVTKRNGVDVQATVAELSAQGREAADLARQLDDLVSMVSCRVGWTRTEIVALPPEGLVRLVNRLMAWRSRGVGRG